MMGKTLQTGLLRKAALALLSACFVPAGTAIAQDDDAPMEEVVVKGFRSSLQQSLAVKRNENGVVDAIVAEDIADFPDLNLAESIQRIPGVSINRMNGEGRQITVRGLTGDFNRIRINGMEAQNTSGGTDSSGGSNRGRDFDFNTFASELFSGITVRKTAQASVEEGAVGATLDLRTSRPFDFDDGLTLSTSIQGGFNDLADEFNPRFAGLVSTRSESFGALLSVAYSNREILEEGFSTVRWDDGNFRSVNGVDCGALPDDPECTAINGSSLVYHPRIPRYGRLTHTQERLGFTGSLQWRPSDRTEISLDALYSQWEAERDEEFLEVFFRSQQGNIDVNSYTTNPSKNIIDSGTFTIDPLSNGTHPIRSEHRYDELTTDFTQVTLNLTHDFTDSFRLNAIAGTTDSEQDVPKQTTILYDAVAQVTNYSFDFRNRHATPAIDFGSLDVTDPSQFAFTEFRDRPQYVENTFDYLAASLEWDIGYNMTLSGGVSYKEFGFDTTEFRRENTNGSRLCDAGYFDCDTDDDGTNDIVGAPLTPDLVSTLNGFGSGGLGMPSGNDRTWISANVNAAANLIGIYSIPGAPQVGNIRSVEEEDLGVWIQLDFSAQLGSIDVRGDVGVRYVETSTTAQGLVVDGDTGDQIVLSADGEYTDTLPALNLVFELTDDFLVRASVAEVMARPSLGDLTPGGSLDSFNGPPFSYDAGNPDLDPYRATNFDLSLEWYFMDDALLSLTYFTKDVDSFFQSSEEVIVPYSQSGLSPTLPPASSPLFVALANGEDPEIEISQTENGGNAKVDGFELIYQQPFTFLPGFWGNFGFTGNYTTVDSDEIVGFSEDAYNATLWYEDDRFSARVSTAYRDPYITRSASSNGRNERGYDSTTNVDLAMAYRLTDSMDLTLEVLNLTDEYEYQIYDAADLVNVYHHTGTEYIVGFRWTPN